MADEAEHPQEAPTSVAVYDLKAILEKYEHDFMGRAHEIVQGIKDLVAAAEKPVAAAVEKVEEAL